MDAALAMGLHRPSFMRPFLRSLSALLAVGCGPATPAPEPASFDAGTYTQMCTADADCVVVKLRDVCNECACARDAVHIASKAKYYADVAALKCEPTSDGRLCAACLAATPKCAQGTCIAVEP